MFKKINYEIIATEHPIRSVYVPGWSGGKHVNRNGEMDNDLLEGVYILELICNPVCTRQYTAMLFDSLFTDVQTIYAESDRQTLPVGGQLDRYCEQLTNLGHNALARENSYRVFTENVCQLCPQNGTIKRDSVWASCDIKPAKSVVLISPAPI